MTNPVNTNGKSDVIYRKKNDVDIQNDNCRQEE